MAKNKNARLTSDAQPTATNVDWPVFVPNSDGSTDIEIGRARLRYGTLVVEFKNSVPAVAIQNMIQRGVLMGFGMIMIKPDVVNEMYQEVVANEEAEAATKTEGILETIVAEIQADDSKVRAYPIDVEQNTFVIQTQPDPVIDEILNSRPDDDVER